MAQKEVKFYADVEVVYKRRGTEYTMNTRLHYSFNIMSLDFEDLVRRKVKHWIADQYGMYEIMSTDIKITKLDD